MFPAEFRDPDTYTTDDATADMLRNGGAVESAELQGGEFPPMDRVRAGERKWYVVIPLGLDESTAVVIQDWADSMKTSPEAVIRHLIRDGLRRRQIE